MDTSPLIQVDELAVLLADPMPTAVTFPAAMRSAGVTMSRPVVTYDDWVSLQASRVWWMLRHFGFLDVRVLDGGIAAWTASAQPMETGPGTLAAGDFSPSRPSPSRLLDAKEATCAVDCSGLIPSGAGPGLWRWTRSGAPKRG